MRKSARRIALTAVVGVGMLGIGTPRVIAQAPLEVSLAMGRDKFAPEELHVKAGSRFVLVLSNSDDITHELDIPKLRMEKKVRPGQTIRLQLPALRPGTYELIDDDSTPSLHGLMIVE